MILGRSEDDELKPKTTTAAHGGTKLGDNTDAQGTDTDDQLTTKPKSRATGQGAKESTTGGVGGANADTDDDTVEAAGDLGGVASRTGAGRGNAKQGGASRAKVGTAGASARSKSALDKLATLVDQGNAAAAHLGTSDTTTSQVDEAAEATNDQMDDARGDLSKGTVGIPSAPVSHSTRARVGQPHATISIPSVPANKNSRARVAQPYAAMSIPSAPANKNTDPDGMAIAEDEERQEQDDDDVSQATGQLTTTLSDAADKTKGNAGMMKGKLGQVIRDEEEEESQAVGRSRQQALGRKTALRGAGKVGLADE